MMLHHFMLWLGSWVSLAQSLVEILSLGFFRPGWEFDFLAWETMRHIRNK